MFLLHVHVHVHVCVEYRSSLFVQSMFCTIVSGLRMKLLVDSPECIIFTTLHVVPVYTSIVVSVYLKLIQCMCFLIIMTSFCC